MSDPVVRLESFGRGPDSRSYVFEQCVDEIVAHEIDAVGPALDAIDRAVAEGRHAAGFVSYDAAPAFDGAMRVPGTHADTPLVWFGVFERRTEIDPEDTADEAPPSTLHWHPSIAADRYRSDLQQIRSYIEAGDTYQVNHTFRLHAHAERDRWTLYRALCRSQRADYCAFIDTGSQQILSASPELFFRRDGDALIVRPMKGTSPRGRWTDEDDHLADALASSEKDRAENLMIVDLLRNDVGRVSEFGSVEVDGMWTVEPYETVFQMTTTVKSRVPGDVGTADLFGALFPCGSVTGAPKLRSMEIIAELEAEPRGLYTGAIGYVSPGASAFSVAIRTVVVDSADSSAVFGVGGGITWDSSTDGEYRECVAKARVLTERRPDCDLFETLKLNADGSFALREGHLDRLSNSARYFGFPFDRTEADRALDAAAGAATGPSRVRLRLSRTGAMRTESAALSQAAGRYRVCVSPVPVDSSDVYLYHKTTWRRMYQDALEACPGVDDVILTNERGELTEFTIGNLVLDLDGRLLTPTLASGLLPGTFRQDLLGAGRLEEAVLYPEQLGLASRIFMINSVREWVEAEFVHAAHPHEDDRVGCLDTKEEASRVSNR